MAIDWYPSHWKPTKLSDLGRIDRGRSRHRPRYASHLYGGPYPFIQTGDIKASGGKITTYSQTYSEAGLAQSRLWQAGTLCITIAANIAETGILTFPACFPDSVVGFIADETKCDVYFVEYMFRYLRSRIQHEASGSVQDNINLATLNRLEFPTPSLPEQRAIAGILGALDDKIELNRCMNRTLESMARAVFRQWFVDGEDVEGWEVGRLGDVAENIRRSANADEIDSETHYIGLEHMPRRSIALSEWGNASELASNKFVFKEGEFLFGKLRPYFHKVGIAPIDGVCSTDILVIAPKSADWYGFALGHISSVELVNYTNAASTGTKMPRTNWSDIANYEVAIPPVEKAKEFSEIFLPIAQRIRANIMESRTLASLRDTLLPKLMRGEVRVRGA